MQVKNTKKYKWLEKLKDQGLWPGGRIKLMLLASNTLRL